MFLTTMFICFCTVLNQMQKLESEKDSNCEYVYTRRDIRSFSNSEREEYYQALSALKLGEYPTTWDLFSHVHYNYTEYIHHLALTWFWHREFIWRIERKLEQVGWDKGLPYWDWTLDFEKPHNSLIFTKEYFGGNGLNTPILNYYKDKYGKLAKEVELNCVNDGPFKDWKVNIPGEKEHCLKREFSDENKLPKFGSPLIIERILEKLSFSDFATRLEGYPHAVVHNEIGGDLGELWGPADPIFFLHHTFLDRLVYEWQLRLAEKKVEFKFTGKGINGVPATTKDILPALGTPINKTFNTTNGRYCYKYNRWNYKNALVEINALNDNKLYDLLNKDNDELINDNNQIQQNEEFNIEKRNFKESKTNFTIFCKSSNDFNLKPISINYIRKFNFDVNTFRLLEQENMNTMEMLHHLVC